MRNLSKKLAIAALSTGLAVLVAEVGLRLFVEQEMKRLAIYDRDLGWRGRPYGKGIYRRKQDGIRVPFAYNNFGFNDDDIVPKPKHATRVVLLGDSFVESLEIPAQLIFHHLLQAKLRESISSSSDVVALCSQGYSTAQELLAFRKFKDIIDADIVLCVFYSGNDFDDNLRPQFACLDEDGTLRFPKNRESFRQLTYLKFKRWLYESSHLVYLAKQAVQSIASVEIADGAKTVIDADEDLKRDISTKLLRQIKVDVEQSGARFGIVIIPSPDEVRGMVEADRTQYISQFCKMAEIPFIDLSTRLTSEDFFPVDIHFNESGHQKTAAAICGFLSREFGLALDDSQCDRVH